MLFVLMYIHMGGSPNENRSESSLILQYDKKIIFLKKVPLCERWLGHVGNYLI